MARSVGMSVASYLRAVGAGYQPRAVVDRDRIDEMLRINGDLGRLGGLLKLWLTNDAKLDQFDRGQIRQAILAALRRIVYASGDRERRDRRIVNGEIAVVNAEIGNVNAEIAVGERRDRGA